ncbi:endonuclease/exonuclease/phosphatase family protein [Nocardioides sp. GY 10127]|uniref:endonuclease/exonuclease/phosphatase family protein n=1 Tax=Nocardioides sp. GY 10127 TaxID=2569762 RepID=UPI001457F914|nr:endonuclease/exonuclease/phosphatase family protein [Nocardioides sp. GY 10127]
MPEPTPAPAPRGGARRVGRVLLWLVVLGLLAPATALTWLRATGQDGDLAVRAVAFAPYALLAQLFVLVLAGGAWWHRRRAVLRLLAALVALAGLGLQTAWLAPLLTGPPAAAEEAVRAGDPSLVVLSSNLLVGGADPAELWDVATGEDADLVVLPEATVDVVAALDDLGAAERWPYRIGTPAPEGSTAGTVVLSRLPLGEPTRLGTIMESWAVDVDVSSLTGTSGDALRLLAAHPAAPADPPSFRSDAAVLRAAVRDEAPDLVVGDLNATLDHVQLRRLLAAGGLRDAAEEAGSGWQPTWPANGLFLDVPAPLVAIDHVLLAPGLEATATRTHRLDGTDHLALVADVVLTGTA